MRVTSRSACFISSSDSRRSCSPSSLRPPVLVRARIQEMLTSGNAIDHYQHGQTPAPNQKAVVVVGQNKEVAATATCASAHNRQRSRGRAGGPNCGNFPQVFAQCLVHLGGAAAAFAGNGQSGAEIGQYQGTLIDSSMYLTLGHCDIHKQSCGFQVLGIHSHKRK